MCTGSKSKFRASWPLDNVIARRLPKLLHMLEMNMSAKCFAVVICTILHHGKQVCMTCDRVFLLSRSENRAWYWTASHLARRLRINFFLASCFVCWCCRYYKSELDATENYRYYSIFLSYFLHKTLPARPFVDRDSWLLTHLTSNGNQTSFISFVPRQ